MATELETRSIFPVELELRQDGRRPVIAGRFPYGQQATIAATGRVRKERFAPHAFQFAVQDQTREINFLLGHNLSQPLAGRRAGTLALVDRENELDFEATLPPEGEQPTWIRDFLLAHRAGLIGGVSPGFTVPPASAVPDAAILEPEPGNPGVFIRLIRAAVLYELSAVTRPAYQDTGLEERGELVERPSGLLEYYRWL